MAARFTGADRIDTWTNHEAPRVDVVVRVRGVRGDRRLLRWVAAARHPGDGRRARRRSDRAPGTDVLAGIAVVPQRIRGYDYRRAAFGEAWDDDNDAPGGHNGCDTRNDILNRDLVDKTYVSIKRCPDAVATGVLHDPYTNTTIAFVRGAQVGASVQIDHIVPLAYAWDMGARDWPDACGSGSPTIRPTCWRLPGRPTRTRAICRQRPWMPPNNAFGCQYSMQFIAVLRGYGLPVDQASADVLREAASSCPAG